MCVPALGPHIPGHTGCNVGNSPTAQPSPTYPGWSQKDNKVGNQDQGRTAEQSSAVGYKQKSANFLAAPIHERTNLLLVFNSNCLFPVRCIFRAVKWGGFAKLTKESVWDPEKFEDNIVLQKNKENVEVKENFVQWKAYCCHKTG